MNLNNYNDNSIERTIIGGGAMTSKTTGSGKVLLKK